MLDETSMPSANDTTLQERFLLSGGQPIRVAGRIVVQMDRITLPNVARVTIKFVSNVHSKDNAAVIGIEKPGEIFLSDGNASGGAVKIWDDPALPSQATYKVKSEARALQVFNKYRTYHSSTFVTEDNFTGNAGMIVTDLGPNSRRYECSNGPGEFSPDDLAFEVTWTEFAE